MQSKHDAAPSARHIVGDDQCRVLVEIRGELAHVVAHLAERMAWPPADVAAALVAVSLEGFDGDEREALEACLNCRARYVAIGRAPEGWVKLANGGPGR